MSRASGSLKRNIKVVTKIAAIFENPNVGAVIALAMIYNAITDAPNAIIQERKKVGIGYRTFQNFRSSILFFHGRTKPVSTRLRLETFIVRKTLHEFLSIMFGLYITHVQNNHSPLVNYFIFTIPMTAHIFQTAQVWISSILNQTCAT